MFHEFFTQSRAQALRLQREELRLQRLLAVSPPRAESLRPPPQPAGSGPLDQSELIVPDGCVALVLRRDEPSLQLSAGRHSLDAFRGLAEVRLLPAERLDAAPEVRAPEVRAPAVRAPEDLPFERAFLLADGVPVAFLRNGFASKAGRKEESARERDHASSGLGELEEEPAQRFSFI